MQQGETGWEAWAWVVGGLVVAPLLAGVGHALLYRLMWRIARRSRTFVDDALVSRTCTPTRVLFPLIAFSAALDVAVDTATVRLPALGLLHQFTVIGVIVTVAWTVVAVINATGDIVERRYRIDIADNLTARRIRTQVELLQRIAVTVVGVIGLAAVLMSFPSVRQLGLSLFASAGVAGIVIGIAARPMLANLIAGMQIAMAQPIRIDDILVVEGEFGRVEEINTTYVVLRIWDERRMIVPLGYFIEKPFTNWTRTGSTLLTTLFVYADYRVDVDAVRAELDRVVRGTGLWDKRVAILQMSDVTERTVQLRALVSAPDAGTAWDLKCLVRERLVAFLRDQPHALPVVRAELDGGAQGEGPKVSR